MITKEMIDSVSPHIIDSFEMALDDNYPDTEVSCAIYVMEELDITDAVLADEIVYYVMRFAKLDRLKVLSACLVDTL